MLRQPGRGGVRGSPLPRWLVATRKGTGTQWQRRGPEWQQRKAGVGSRDGMSVRTGQWQARLHPGTGGESQAQACRGRGGPEGV